MNDQIRTLLDRLDEELLLWAAGQHLDLFLLGRAALVLSYQFTLFTQDIDIVSTQNSELERRAIEVLGKGSPLARTLGLYLDPVPQGLPPLPSWYRRRCLSLAGNWKVLRVWTLEVHDLAVTKLKSFRPQDRQDLQILCDRGLLDAAKLHESLQAAFPFRSPKTEDAEDDMDNPGWGKALTSWKRVNAYLQGSITSI